LFSVQNSRKARDGGLAGLMDPSLLAGKEASEKALRDAVKHDARLKFARGAWKRIAQAEKVRAETAVRYSVLELGQAFQSKLFEAARTLVRAGEEKPKPNGERLREFRDSNLKSLEQQLFSAAPLYDNFETAKLANSLTWLAEKLGNEDPLVRKVLDGQSPQE